MRKLLPKAVFLVGPTGVGKSALATKLALRLGGEIVGADAFQIYQGLPMLTAHPSPEEQALVPHHLIGVVPLTASCDAGHYRTMALPLLEDIRKRHRLPLVVGGTGFYIRSLLDPLDPLPQPDPLLRTLLAQRSHEELLEQLQQLDPQAIQKIDLKNRRRVERAIEIMSQTGKTLDQLWQQKKKTPQESFCGFLLVRSREELYQRIESNVQSLFQHGVLEEIAALDTINISSTASMALGWRDIQAYRRGEQSLSTTIEMMIRATKHYAKRQLTWFKHQHSFPTLNLSLFPSLDAAVEEIIMQMDNKL